MEDQRKFIRPEVLVEKEAESNAERFQNAVVRPVLKMQNDLFLAIYRHFLRKRKVPFQGMSKVKRMDWIEQSLQKDNRLRGLMLGTVVGHFTMDEWQSYQQEENEINRRIINLIQQRLIGQLDRLL